MPTPSFDVIVIGAGIAGLSAAKLTAQAGLKTASVEALLFGGLVININELEPAPPGAPHSGTELASDLMMQVSELGVESISETVVALERDGTLFSVTTDAGRHTARAVIVASGARLKRLGIPGEAEFEHRGVAQCADCDGPMYKDETVMVVGGGDSALQEALVLAHYVKAVHLVHRGTQYRARPAAVAAVEARENILKVWNTVPEAVLGEQMVSRVRVRDIGTGATREIASSGFFAYIGLEPNSEFLPAEVARDDAGFVITDASLQTAMPGLAAVGAVRAGYGGMLTDAMADAETAARSVIAAIGK